MSGPSVITIGNFDGVHIGHREIVRAARELAAKRNARVLAVTFDPMPVNILRPGSGPPLVASIDQRVDELKRAGVDEVVTLRPTPELLGQTAEQFIASLVEAHDAVGFVEGEDFRFGRGRAGDMAVLSAMGSERGFEVVALPRVVTGLSDYSTAPVSSSLVRWLVGRGRVEDASACLGRPFEMRGTIVQGEQRGRTIGVPTANLDPTSWRGRITPMDGVYAGSVALEGEHAAYSAAISVGVKPTFGHDQLTIEAHLIGYAAPTPDALYGRAARFSFAHWLRDQYPFPGIETLVAQLRRDIDAARRRMHAPAGDPISPAYD